jgi:hypothetical protein
VLVNAMEGEGWYRLVSVVFTYLVLGRRTRGREGLGGVGIGSLLGCC